MLVKYLKLETERNYLTSRDSIDKASLHLKMKFRFQAFSFIDFGRLLVQLLVRFVPLINIECD